MNFNHINDLLELYFVGDSSIAQEKELKSYFNSDQVATEHLQFKSLFSYFSEAKHISTNLDFNEANLIDELLEKYFEGETEISEEQTLKAYFSGNNVEARHENYSSLFTYFTKAKEVSFDKEIQPEGDIDDLLEKYFEAQSSIEEERKLKAYFNSGTVAAEHKQFSELFEYFSTAQAENLEKGIELDLNKKAKKGQLRVLRRRMMGVAAGFVLLIASVFIMKTNISNDDQLLSEAERIEAEAALETTMEALAMLGVQFNKGTESLENMKAFKKTQILKQ